MVALFMDISGFTRLVESGDPEDVRERLRGPFELAADSVRRRGGRVEKYIGDAIFAVFGVERSHRDDVDRAIMAALTAREHLRTLPRPLDLHAGIELGEVLVDRLASLGADDLAVVGDAINTAARLLHEGEAGDVVLGPEAAALTTAPLSTARTVRLKGKAEPVRVQNVLGWPESEPRVREFVGREVELREVLEVAEMVRSTRRPKAVQVIGEPGIGKSRLVREAAMRSGMPFLRIQCPPPGEATVAEILRPLAGNNASELVRVSAGLDSAPGEYSSLVAAHGRVGMVWNAWREHFEVTASHAGLVLIVDDAQWCPTDVVDILVNSLVPSTAPVLLLLTAWNEVDLKAWRAFHTASIPVGPLADADARALAVWTGRTQDIADAIVQKAEGNPLYLLSVHADPASDLPLGVRQAVTARLDALPQELRDAAQSAAVIATAVFPSGLAALMGTDTASAHEFCNRLVRDDMLVAAADGFVFTHSLLASTAYASLSREGRRRLHARAAEWMAGAGGSPAGIARHLEGAGDTASAATMYRDAAAEAMHRISPAEAVDLLGRAANLTQPGEQLAAILVERGHALGAVRRLVEAAESFAAAEEITADAAVTIRAVCGRALMNFWNGHVEVAEELGERAVALAEATPVHHAEPDLVMAFVRTSQGRSNEASRYVESGAAAAAYSGMHGLAAMAKAITISIHHHAGRPSVAAEMIGEAARLCRATAQPGALVWALWKGGLAHAAMGSYTAALETWDELDRVAGGCDYPAMLAESQNARGHVLRELGVFAEADECDTRSIDMGTTYGSTEGVANAKLNLACSALIRGDFVEAERHLLSTQPEMDAFAFFRWRYMQRYRHYRALIDQAAGDETAARRITEESLQIGRRTGEGKNTLRPELTLARLQMHKDRVSAQGSFVKVALEAERLGLLPIAWRARAAAAELHHEASHHAALAILRRIEEASPPDRRAAFRRMIAGPVEDRNYAVWRMPL